jgi:hypothetical protein
VQEDVIKQYSKLTRARQCEFSLKEELFVLLNSKANTNHKSCSLFYFCPSGSGSLSGLEADPEHTVTGLRGSGGQNPPVNHTADLARNIHTYNRKRWWRVGTLELRTVTRTTVKLVNTKDVSRGGFRPLLVPMLCSPKRKWFGYFTVVISGLESRVWFCFRFASFWMAVLLRNGKGKKGKVVPVLS